MGGKEQKPEEQCAMCLVMVALHVGYILHSIFSGRWEWGDSVIGAALVLPLLIWWNTIKRFHRGLLVGWILAAGTAAVYMVAGRTDDPRSFCTTASLLIFVFWTIRSWKAIRHPATVSSAVRENGL